MLPNSVHPSGNGAVGTGEGCGNGNGTCCSSGATTSPTTTTVVVDIEDILNKRNLEQNKKDSIESVVTPPPDNETCVGK